MELRYHSGGCCGIKVICNIGRSPKELYSCEYDGEIEEDVWRDCDETHCSATALFAPKRDLEGEKTSGQAFDEILAYLNEHRPGTLVQLAIIVGFGSFTQSPWVDFLTERGFKSDGEFQNGNSGNMIRVLSTVIRPDELREDDEEDYPHSDDIHDD